jgi:hypothetical protein
MQNDYVAIYTFKDFHKEKLEFAWNKTKQWFGI